MRARGQPKSRQESGEVFYMWSRLHSAVKVGIVVAVLAFFVKFEVTTTIARSGEATICSYVNYLAIVAGLFCVGAGILGLRLGTKSNLPPLLAMAKQSHLVLGIVLILLGIVHLLAGFGLILSPCKSPIVATST